MLDETAAVTSFNGRLDLDMMDDPHGFARYPGGLELHLIGNLDEPWLVAAGWLQLSLNLQQLLNRLRRVQHAVDLGCLILQGVKHVGRYQ